MLSYASGPSCCNAMAGNLGSDEEENARNPSHPTQIQSWRRKKRAERKTGQKKEGKREGTKTLKEETSYLLVDCL